MQLYCVKLKPNHSVVSQCVSDSGYLVHYDPPFEVCCYERGEALKKAKVFGGKIEKFGKDYKIEERKTIILNRMEFSHEVIVRLMIGTNHRMGVVPLATDIHSVLSKPMGLSKEAVIDLSAMKAMIMSYDSVMFV